jgi:putative ABC transport system permease protein
MSPNSRRLSLDTFLQDLKYAVRAFRKEPGLALIATVILAVGIGANTAVFSIVNPLVLRPLPFPQSDRLVWIANSGTTGLSGRTYRVDVYEIFQRNTQSLQELTAYFAFFGYGSHTLTGRGEPERLAAVDVAPRFFEMLGVNPERGRLFTADEYVRGGPRAAILGHGLWQRRFASDPAIVGSVITINGEPVTVVGIMPADFDFSSIFTPGTRVDMFVPAILDVMRPWGNTLSVIGRLKPGVTLADARAEFATMMPRLRSENPKVWGFGAVLTSLKEQVSGRMRRSLFVLWAAVGCVLLIVCANLANLLLARASARSREFAVRIALGAGRARIIRQLLTEGVLLSAVGAALGVPLAFGLTSWLTSSQTLSLPLLHYVRVDTTALAATAVISVITGVIFAMVPALKVSARAPQAILQEHSRGSVDSPRHAWIRRGLVISEVALAAVLIVGAGLLVRSFIQLLDVRLGFEPSQAVAARIQLQGQVSAVQQSAIGQELVRRVSQLPGVEAAGLTDALPLDRNRTWIIYIDGHEYPNNQRPLTFVYVVGPGYFPAMGIPLKSGREFSDSDLPDSEGNPPKPRPVILNETLARILYPGVDPVGRPAMTGSMPLTIVGVVADVRQTSLDEAPVSQMYLAIAQGSGSGSDVIVRTSTPPASFAPVLRKTLARLDSRLMATDVRLVGDLVDRAVSPRRFMVSLLGGFSVLALLLASLGIYGVVSYGVNQRVPEIGVRMALGATAADVRRQILGETLKLALAGIVLGAIASFAMSQVIGSLLYATSATDPLTFAGMVGILGFVAVVAGYLPARRASRIDPMRALRAE